MKKIICVDFDGVLHSYTSGWKGPQVVPDPPVPGAMKWLYEAVDVFDVQIYSSRSKETFGVPAMCEWIQKHLAAEYGTTEAVATMKKLSFPTQKPAAFLTIDDRAFLFQGTFPSVEFINNFKPWNKQ